MNFKQANGISIRESFLEFHKDNPVIYDYFKKYFFYLHNEKKIKRVSSKLIINRIRWEVFIKTSGDPYKINDAYTAHYARLFVSEFPQYKEAFEFRRIRSEAPLQASLFESIADAVKPTL